MIERLAELVATTGAGRRALVAIDGVDTSGKTTLADALAAAVAPHREVLRASVDDFHRPRAERYQRGRTSAEGCYRDTFDHHALRDRLLVPFRDGLSCVTAASDRERDRALRPALDVGWDLRIHLSIPDDEVLRRAALRDGDDALPLYRERYLPAQRLYDAECAPTERADVLLDYTDPAAPVILRRPP